MMKVNDADFVAQTEGKKLSIRFSEPTLENFVVMPDHLHAIIVSNPVDDKPRTIGTIIRSYKSTVARLINGLRHTPGTPIWLRNYYECIIRCEKEFENIWNYIEDNPSRWGKT